jgi:hypothetical protein
MSLAPAPPRFTLPIAAGVAWGLYVVARVGFFVRGPQASSPYALGQLVGEMVLTLTLPTLLSWLMWRFARRSGPVGNVTFFVVFGLAILTQFTPAARQVLVDKSSTADRDLSDTGQPVGEEIAAAIQRYTAASRQLELRTFFDLHRIESAEQIAEKRKLVEAFQSASEELKRFQNGAVKTQQRDGLPRRVPAAHPAWALIGDRENADARLAAIPKRREADDQLADAMHAFLDLAQYNLGAWRFEPDAQHVVFDNDGAAVRYNAVVSQVLALANEQPEVRRLLAGMK